MDSETAHKAPPSFVEINSLLAIKAECECLELVCSYINNLEQLGIIEIPINNNDYTDKERHELYQQRYIL
jgi:hypothetical protein